jgi:protein-S-isoprenylcysteine O-methyltransferase Ste14
MMGRHALRSLALVAPATLLFGVALPVAARFADRRLGLEWSPPAWLRTISLLPLALGPALAVWSAWLLTFSGQGTPNPMSPPAKLVVRAPYTWSRNPLMIGGWSFGLGLLFTLGSPTLLGMYLVIVVIGMLYVWKMEEPRLLERFGDEYRAYAARVPPWFLLVLSFVAASTAGS